jgi:hypothetical protein
MSWCAAWCSSMLTPAPKHKACRSRADLLDSYALICQAHGAVLPQLPRLNTWQVVQYVCATPAHCCWPSAQSHIAATAHLSLVVPVGDWCFPRPIGQAHSAAMLQLGSPTTGACQACWSATTSQSAPAVKKRRYCQRAGTCRHSGTISSLYLYT